MQSVATAQQELSERTIDSVRVRLRQNKQFRDLSYFSVLTYSFEELKEMGADPNRWAGQYVAGSALSEDGITVLINVHVHETQADMADTIAHEVGHALWELCEDEDRIKWAAKYAKTKWGPEEFFADQLMFYVRGEDVLPDFMEMTKVE